MSVPQPPSTESRAERTLMRTLTALAAVGWAAAPLLALARTAGDVPLAESTFGVLSTWTLVAAVLGLGVHALRAGDAHGVRLLAHLDLGNPDLDDLLRPARTHWRAHPATRTVGTAVAAASWGASIVYSTQIALGIYRVAPATELLLLRWLLFCAIWSTALAVTAPAQARRAAALRLAATAHQAQREERERLERAAAESDLGATGEIPRLHPGRGSLEVVGFERTPGRRAQRRYGAS